jgi:hypothetical protein
MRLAPSGRLSVQARRVLEALARTGDGQLTVREVLGQVRQPGTSLAVTRASVSRTPRRLWRAGYVEVTDKRGITLTGHVAPIQRWVQAVATAPALAYRAYLKQQGATNNPCSSASAYATACADYAARMHEMRVRTVTPTDASHAAVNGRLTSHSIVKSVDFGIDSARRGGRQPRNPPSTSAGVHEPPVGTTAGARRRMLEHSSR